MQREANSRASPGVGDIPESQSLAPGYWLDKGLSFRLLKISINQLEEKGHNRVADSPGKIQTTWLTSGGEEAVPVGAAAWKGEPGKSSRAGGCACWRGQMKATAKFLLVRVSRKPVYVLHVTKVWPRFTQWGYSLWLFLGTALWTALVSCLVLWKATSFSCRGERDIFLPLQLPQGQGY